MEDQNYTESIGYLIILALVLLVFFLWNNRRLNKQRSRRRGESFKLRYQARKEQQKNEDTPENNQS